MNFNKIISLIFFFIAVLIILNVAGKKATFYFLTLVIVGQLVVNAGKVESLSNINSVTNTLTT